MAVTKKTKPTTIKDQKTTETIERARETGRLTFDELDAILPEDATPQEIDDVMVALSDTNVELVDEYKIDSERKAEDTRKAKIAKKAELRREAAHCVAARTPLMRAADLPTLLRHWSRRPRSMLMRMTCRRRRNTNTSMSIVRI